MTHVQLPTDSPRLHHKCFAPLSSILILQNICASHHSAAPAGGIHAEPYEDFHEPPMFTVELNHVKTNEGHNAHFACRVEPAGDGTMRVEWSKDGRPILTGNLWTTYSLHIALKYLVGSVSLHALP